LGLKKKKKEKKRKEKEKGKGRNLLTNVRIVSENDLDSSLGSHDGNLGGGPGVVNVSSEMLGAHDIISSSISLSGDHGDLGDSGFSVSIEQFGTMLDNLD